MSADPLLAVKTRIKDVLGTVAKDLLEQVKEEIATLKVKHESSLKDALDLYQTQNEQLSREQKELQGQLDQAKKSLEKKREKLTAANTEIKRLQGVLKEKEESISDLNIKVSDTDKQLQDLQTENTSLQRKATRLNELEGFAKELHGDEAWIKKLDTMWESVRRLVELHLKEDVPEDKLEDLGNCLNTWKQFGKSQVLNRLPLPRSNSPPAKRMRIAAMLAIISRCIDQHIFHPTYILGEDEDKDDGIRPLLVNLATANSRKESHLRAVLLSIEPEKQAENASKKVGQVVAEVASYAQHVLSAGQCKKFKSGLEQLVQQALEAWQMAQCTRDKFETLFALDDDFEWQLLGFEEGNTVNGDQSTAKVVEIGEELLVIFPRICFIGDEECALATDGVVLMKSQALEAAKEVDVEKEKERSKPSSPTAGKVISRLKSNGPRSKVTSNGVNGFLSPSTPSSAQQDG
jgi:hypothetical protein